eukprot:m.336471 g.336471  ORF g.336471 m.336471 type:complete len:178 (+) comp17861_c0_seq1:109-642(+)
MAPTTSVVSILLLLVVSVTCRPSFEQCTRTRNQIVFNLTKPCHGSSKEVPTVEDVVMVVTSKENLIVDFEMRIGSQLWNMESVKDHNEKLYAVEVVDKSTSKKGCILVSKPQEKTIAVIVAHVDIAGACPTCSSHLLTLGDSDAEVSMGVEETFFYAYVFNMYSSESLPCPKLLALE